MVAAGNSKAVFRRQEEGITLAETIVALAILAAITVVFLGGLVTSSKAVIVSDRQATAESLARGQMEWVQSEVYVENATQYTPATLSPVNDYQDYSVNITSSAVHIPDRGIQKITVMVSKDGNSVVILEGYKRR